MGRFLTGVLVGLGISLLIAPKPGKELRQLLAQSWKDMRSLPATTEQAKPLLQKQTEPHKPPAQEKGEPIPSAQEVAERAAERGTTVPDTSQPTQQAVAGQGDLSQPTQQAGPNALPPRQGGTGTTKPPRPPRPTP